MPAVDGFNASLCASPLSVQVIFGFPNGITGRSLAVKQTYFSDLAVACLLRLNLRCTKYKYTRYVDQYFNKTTTERRAMKMTYRFWHK